MTEPTTQPAEPLTMRQKRVLQFIVASVEARGYPPSVRELCASIGVTSPSTVHHVLMRLERLGYIRRAPSQARAIEVVVPPRTDRCPECGAVRS